MYLRDDADLLEIFDGISTHAHHKELIKETIEMYKYSKWLIRLPGYINMPSFTERPEKIIQVPLVVRKARRSSESVRSELGLSERTKVLLITFGGHELSKLSEQWDMSDILPDGWVGVIIGPGKTDWRGITEKSDNKLLCVASEDWFLPDLIQASDVVLSKWYVSS